MHFCADEVRMLLMALPVVGYCVRCVLLKMKLNPKQRKV